MLRGSGECVLQGSSECSARERRVICKGAASVLQESGECAARERRVFSKGEASAWPPPAPLAVSEVEPRVPEPQMPGP